MGSLLTMASIDIPLLVPILCFILGIVFVVIEIFQPGFGVFGIIGSILLLAGIVLRALSGGGFLEIGLIILFLLIFFIVLIVCAAKSAKNGRLSKTPFILSENAVSESRSTATADYSYLLDQEGEAVTFLRPIGKAKIGGDVIEVISENAEIINQGEKIKVIFVEGQRVVVKKI